jgi:two-component system chemotaxis response regulator CheB
MIKVLIVDDSGFMRLALRKLLDRSGAIEVVGEACTGSDAIQKARLLMPDVITMDVEMPDMDGVTATREILSRQRIPIIMISSLTRAAGRTTLAAMDAGAVDFIPKASSYVDLDIIAIERELTEKIVSWHGRYRTTQSATPSDGPANIRARRHTNFRADLLVIGASTGGPRVIPDLLRQLPELHCPLVIAVHMPEAYTAGFASHLSETTGHRCIESYTGHVLVAGQVVIAAGGRDTFIKCNFNGPLMLQVRKDSDYGIHPSVDALFSSAAHTGLSVGAAVLTGMGQDGLHGAELLSGRNQPVLTQDEASSLVYGMPRAVAEAGYASGVMDIGGIAENFATWGRRETLTGVSA